MFVLSEDSTVPRIVAPLGSWFCRAYDEMMQIVETQMHVPGYPKQNHPSATLNIRAEPALQ
jgi:hypothetical protein